MEGIIGFLVKELGQERVKRRSEYESWQDGQAYNDF